METGVLVKFVRHLLVCTEDVMGKDEIETYDVRSLRRELAELQRHIDGQERVDPVILDRILGLQVRVDENLLGDSRQSVGLKVLTTLLHIPGLGAHTRVSRQEDLRRQVGGISGPARPDQVRARALTDG